MHQFNRILDGNRWTGKEYIEIDNFITSNHQKIAQLLFVRVE
jgi:hypothetical protein